jgi:hypothetical protein
MSHLIEIGLILAAIWLGALLVNYRADCRRCNGTGRHRWSTPGQWGDCRKCGGSGKRLRFGAKTANRIILRREL